MSKIRNSLIFKCQIYDPQPPDPISQLSRELRKGHSGVGKLCSKVIHSPFCNSIEERINYYNGLKLVTLIDNPQDPSQSVILEPERKEMSPFPCNFQHYFFSLGIDQVRTLSPDCCYQKPLRTALESVGVEEIDLNNFYFCVSTQ